jgi:hypothetical protein
MSEQRTVKKVFKNVAEGKRSVEKPRRRWLDDVENELKKMVLVAGEKIARDASKLILREARVLRGP